MSFEWADYLRIGVLTAFSFACMFTDLKSRRIYNTLTLPVIVFALLSAWFYSGPGVLLSAVMGAILGIVLFLPGVYLGKTGAGDLKLSAAFGALLGWKLLLIALLGAGLVSFVIYIIVKTRKYRNLPAEYPLGIIISVAAFAAGIIEYYGFRPDMFF